MNLTALDAILGALQGLTLHDPVPYLEMQRLQISARASSPAPAVTCMPYGRVQTAQEIITRHRVPGQQDA